MSARLSGLTIGALTLAPTFNSDVTEYTTTTTNATHTITATPEDEDAAVPILNGETPATNASPATWTAGAHTVQVPVNNGPAGTAATVTVTKQTA